MIDIIAEVQKFFDGRDASRVASPRLALIAGGTAVGKSRYRRKNYGSEYVVLDAADIFIGLSQGHYFDFPSTLEEPMEIIGASVARRAVRERRNIVTEIVGHEFEPTKALINAMRSANYFVDVIQITKDVAEAWEWNLARSENNISALYTEPYHRRWLIGAVAERHETPPVA